MSKTINIVREIEARERVKIVELALEAAVTLFEKAVRENDPFDGAEHAGSAEELFELFIQAKGEHVRTRVAAARLPYGTEAEFEQLLRDEYNAKFAEDADSPIVPNVIYAEYSVVETADIREAA